MLICKHLHVSSPADGFPCSSFSHLLSSAVRKDRGERSEVGAGGEGDVAADVVGCFRLLPLSKEAGVASAEVPATGESTSSSDAGVRSDEEEEEEEEEEQDAADRGASSQLPRGKVLRDEAATKPTHFSPVAAASRMCLDFREKPCSLTAESSARLGEPPTAA